jgi:hypothetical protein
MNNRSSVICGPDAKVYMKAHLLNKFMGTVKSEKNKEIVCREINEYIENRASLDRLSYKDVANITLIIRNKI